MKKRFIRFISTVMCFTLLCSMTAFAEKEELAHSDVGQIKYVDDIDEYLAKLNAGLIVPRNTTITTFCSATKTNGSYTPVSPLSWPWTECSNVFGHEWSEWSSWRETSRFCQPNAAFCIAHIERWRYCKRTHCDAWENETDLASVKCCNP